MLSPSPMRGEASLNRSLKIVSQKKLVEKLLEKFEPRTPGELERWEQLFSEEIVLDMSPASTLPVLTSHPGPNCHIKNRGAHKLHVGNCPISPVQRDVRTKNTRVLVENWQRSTKTARAIHRILSWDRTAVFGLGWRSIHMPAWKKGRWQHEALYAQHSSVAGGQTSGENLQGPGFLLVHGRTRSKT